MWFSQTFDGSPPPFISQAAAWKTTEPWSSHPVYARYWRHYHQAMAWMRSHHNAYRKAVESYLTGPWFFPPASLPRSSYADEAGSPWPSRDRPPAPPDSRRSHSHTRRSGQRPRACATEKRARPAEEEADSESDGGVECDLSNMEITEELRQYFAETERHREERRKCAPGPTCFLPRPAFCVVSCPGCYFVSSCYSASSPASALSLRGGVLI